MRIPGRTGAVGGETIASDAAMPCGSALLLLTGVAAVVVGVVAPVWGGVAVEPLLEASFTMVDCEDDREKPDSGVVRCVPCSSANGQSTAHNAFSSSYSLSASKYSL